jgi:hypothetical protein
MILTSLLKKNKTVHLFTVLTCVCIFVVQAQVAHAQNAGLSLSVTPTLFQMSAVPEQTWQSGVKVINSNPFPLTIYAQVVNFAPQGESGEGKFIPVFETATEGTTLAEWITIAREPITIAPEETQTIPFSVSVPKNAAPGGHFSAILIGTKPPESKGKIRVSTSQVVTSLFFVRIAGDVLEEGSIREFRTTERFVQTPHADFEVRFENKGNVHLQPQGDIVITNMWGKERGVVPINSQTHFGNVLPKSIRKFEFSWKGEESFADIGRYKAVLTLGYGTDEKKFETSTLYFYVVPVKATAIFLGSLLAFVLLVRWSITAYVRRMLLLSGIDPGTSASNSSRFIREGDVRILKKSEMRAPITAGVSDFKASLRSATALLPRLRAVFGFIKLYHIFFIYVVCITALLGLIVYFILSARTDTRDYEITIENPDATVSLSSEDVLYNEQKDAAQKQSPSNTEQQFTLTLVNSSSVPGAAAKLATELEAMGYTIAELESDFSKVKEKTVIVYSGDTQDDAFALSKILGGALLSAQPASASSTSEIFVYIGEK